METKFSFRVYDTNCQKCSGKYVDCHPWKCNRCGDLEDSLPRLSENDDRTLCPHCQN